MDICLRKLITHAAPNSDFVEEANPVNGLPRALDHTLGVLEPRNALVEPGLERLARDRPAGKQLRFQVFVGHHREPGVGKPTPGMYTAASTVRSLIQRSRAARSYLMQPRVPRPAPHRMYGGDLPRYRHFSKVRGDTERIRATSRGAASFRAGAAAAGELAASAVVVEWRIVRRFILRFET